MIPLQILVILGPQTFLHRQQHAFQPVGFLPTNKFHKTLMDGFGHFLSVLRGFFGHVAAQALPMLMINVGLGIGTSLGQTITNLPTSANPQGGFLQQKIVLTVSKSETTTMRHTGENSWATKHTLNRRPLKRQAGQRILSQCITTVLSLYREDVFHKLEERFVLFLESGQFTLSLLGTIVDVGHGSPQRTRIRHNGKSGFEIT